MAVVKSLLLSDLKETKTRPKQRSPDVWIKKYKPIPKTKEEFASNIYVRSGGKMQRFVFYDYQKKIQKSIDENPFTDIFKVRQIGVTEHALIDLNADCVGLHHYFDPQAFLGLFISWRHAIEVRSAGLRFRQIAKEVERVYGVPLENDNVYSPKYKDGGMVNFRSGLNADNAIGESSGCKICFDEARRYPLKPLLVNAGATMETLGEKGRLIVMSTFGAITDDYGQVLLDNNPLDFIGLVEKVRRGEIDSYQEFKDKKNWNKIIVHWKAHPIYGKDDDYIKKKIASSPASESDILREHDLLIEGSAESVFKFSLVDSVFILEKDEEIDENAEYYFGIDTNGGGQDYCVCTVLKVIDGKIYLIDYYRNRTNTTPVHLDRISQLIKKYKPYRVSVETNAGGKNYYDLIKDNFPSLDLNEHFTSESSKANIIVKLLYLMENDEFRGLNQQVIREEFLSFQKIGKKYEAIQGKHDDIVMSTAIGCSGIRFYK